MKTTLISDRTGEAPDVPAASQTLRERAQPLTLDPDELAALVDDGRKWRRFWDPDMVQLRREAFETELVRRAREASWDLSSAADWKRAANSPSYAEVVQRRAKFGPMTGTFGRDREAMARWVATGSSQAPVPAARTPEPQGSLSLAGRITSN